MDNIEIIGYIGTWYVIGEEVFDKKVYLLESEVWGDEVPCLITDENFNVILDDVYNGFDDYEDYLAYMDICHNVE